MIEYMNVLYLHNKPNIVLCKQFLSELTSNWDIVSTYFHQWTKNKHFHGNILSVLSQQGWSRKPHNLAATKTATAILNVILKTVDELAINEFLLIAQKKKHNLSLGRLQKFTMLELFLNIYGLNCVELLQTSKNVFREN